MSFPEVPIRHVAPADRQRLIDIARASVHAAATGERPPRLTRVDLPPDLWRPGASFVTLRRRGELRGCIGTLEPRRPLAVDVADNAVGAATRDPRFPPLRAEEEDDLEVTVSVLTPPERLAVGSWTELASTLVPGVDGLIVEAGQHRATYLPAVWDQLPTATDFLDSLWAKAGLGPREWPETIQVSRYRADEL